MKKRLRDESKKRGGCLGDGGRIGRCLLKSRYVHDSELMSRICLEQHPCKEQSKQKHAHLECFPFLLKNGTWTKIIFFSQDTMPLCI